jgi:hypothetical protein
LKNPDSSEFPEFPDFFPEYPGFTLQTLSHKCSASPLLITSHFYILLPIQMVRVKVSRGNEEPSTQRRTKARHDPAALRAVQEVLEQEGSQRSSRPRRGDPPPSYAEGSEEEIEEEERRGPRVMVTRKMRLMSSHSSLLVAMKRGQLKKNLAISPIPKRAIKPHMFIKADPLLVSLLNIGKEYQLISAPKPLLGSLLPSHKMSG